MNLYKICIKHYAPKDSKKGIKFFDMAEDDESLFEKHKKLFMKSYRNDRAETKYYNPDDYKKLAIKQKKEPEDYRDYSDLYYGKTFWSWKNLGKITKKEFKIFEKFNLVKRNKK